MNMLANLKTDESIQNEKDTLGGNLLESGLYTGKITSAYMKKAESEALGIYVTIRTADGKDIKTSQFVTSGKDKGCKNYYEKDGVKNYLPGFNIINSLCLLTVGKELGDMESEEKVVKIYDSTAKAEVPTKVPVLTELLGKEIMVGVIKQTVDKTTKVGNEYVPTGETRDENEVDKFFRAEDKMTTSEIRAGATEASFYNDWSNKWTGKTRNKAKGAAAAGTAGAPAASGSTKKPASSLFGPKS